VKRRAFLKSGAGALAAVGTMAAPTYLARAATPVLRFGRVEDGPVAWAIRQRSVSHPRSSNRTCPIKASGSPTGFTVRHTESKLTARGFGAVSNFPSPLDTAMPAAPVFDGVCRRGWCKRRARLMRTVKSYGPDASTPASSS
jgi:hypothetical protein